MEFCSGRDVLGSTLNTAWASRNLEPRSGMASVHGK